MDFDIDRRTRGQLAHSLLEKLCQEPRRFDWTDEEIHLLLESLREATGMLTMDSFVWQGLKERHLKLARKFLRAEQDWLRQFPKTRVLATEKSFEFSWDLEKQTVAKTGVWKIRGRIDRIDHDGEGHLVLIDYKMSAGDYKHHGKWIEKNQLQLALYILAIEEGVIEGIPPQEVVGAFYYVLKNMNRDKGLKLEGSPATLFNLDRKGNKITAEKKEELIRQLKGVIQDVIINMQQGSFRAQPLEPEKCGECNWKNLCKAPHLN
jgi:ATP-dependent helicase/DNAse subunit B